ncbi:MAG: hypothetical protein Q7R39_07795 [Dehalococcoidia bacterium]|nr:hypothetical protein [Dehalococcoidia bacterium]
MPSDQFHIEKAERNEEFYNSFGLSTSTFNEWAAVVLFYVAMHYVDAILAREAGIPSTFQHPTSHVRRNSALSMCPTLNSIASAYLHLYNRSREARYDFINFPDGYLGQLQASYFDPTRQNLRTALGLPP